MRGFCRGCGRGFGYGYRGKGYDYDRSLGRRVFNKCLGWGCAFGRCFKGGFNFRRWGR